MQVFLFEEQAQEEAVEAGEQVPVEEPQVVADGVGPEVGELDALALALLSRSPLVLPTKIFLDTISSRCSRARKSGSSSGFESGMRNAPNDWICCSARNFLHFADAQAYSTG